MAQQTYNARLRFSVEDTTDGRAIVQHLASYPGLQHLIGPQRIHLQGGATYTTIEMPQALRAQPGTLPGPSLLVLTTDTPGVTYWVGTRGPGQNAVQIPRLLWDLSETVRTQDFDASPTPVWADAGNWLNHSTDVATAPDFRSRFRFDTVEDEQIRYGSDTGRMREASNQPCHSRLVLGRANKLNLGEKNDGISFAIWYMSKAALVATVRLWFGSHPYTENTNEDDLADTDGDENDTDFLTQNATGATNFPPHWYTAGHSPQAQNVWQLMHVRKPDFSASQLGGVDPDWSRITWMQIATASPNSADVLFGPLWALSEGQGFRQLDSVAIETIQWQRFGNDADIYDRNGLALVLNAPPGYDGHVEYFLGVV